MAIATGGSARKRPSVRRGLRWIVGGAAFIGLVAGWAACHLTERVRTKERLPHADASPHPAHELGAPELQVEDHTCGFHSLSIVYRAHGLDPEQEQLRARLGVDVPAIPKDSSTTGTLHPDLLRVLRQDRFDSSFLDPDAEDTPATLERLTAAGRAALVLIQRAESGGLHWVAVSRSSVPGHVRVFDSLVSEPYDVRTREYLRERVLSVVTIEPDPGAGFANPKSVYAEGIAEMWRVKQRLAARSPQSAR